MFLSGERSPLARKLIGRLKEETLKVRPDDVIVAGNPSADVVSRLTAVVESVNDRLKKRPGRLAIALQGSEGRTTAPRSEAPALRHSVNYGAS
jgi:hypothetical protein